MACTKKITEDILFSCDDKPKAGLKGSKAVILNFDDIDRTSSTQTGALITSLVAESTGFSVEWYKNLASTNAEYTKNTEDVDGFTHSFLCRLSTTTLENIEAATKLKNGRFLMAIHTEYEGVDREDAFKIYGWENGLELAEMTSNSNENSGSILYTLSTREGMNEEYIANIFLDTDYATSKVEFDNLFAPEV